MLQIRGNEIKRADKKLLRRFCQYALDMYVPANVQAESTIIIKFIHPEDLKTAKLRREFRDCRAWMEYDGVKHKKRHFTIEVCYSSINARAKDQIKRIKTAIEYIGHELIHVKQYLKNEMFDYKNEDVRYRGKRFTDWKEGEKYYFTPWEIEAYGHMTGLYMCFKAKIKEEAKGK